MAKIFISYSRSEQEITKILAQNLERMRHQVWLDRKLTGGEDWWKVICEQIAGCDVFIFLVSTASLESEFCRKELVEALKLRKFIIPVKKDEDISDESLPPEIGSRQIINANDADYLWMNGNRRV